MRKLRDIKKIFYIFLIIFLSFILIKKYLFYSILKDNHLPKNLKLQNGDIILRKESNRISDLFAAINNSEYSHIGTFLFIKNKPKIVHIEDDDYSNDYKISSPLKFMKYASHYAIYSYGVKLAYKLNVKQLKTAFAIFLACVGLKMVLF